MSDIYAEKVQQRVFDNIKLAREVADDKWGRKSGVNGPWLERPHSGTTILMEEVGEVARAILEGDSKNLEEELYDVCQVAVAWLEAITSRNDETFS